jgi:hypothetical protein
VKLPYVKKVNYLSPSSLRQIEEDPLGFYLKRMAPKPETPIEDSFPPSFPSSVGQAFDGYVKECIAGLAGVAVVPPLAETVAKVVVEPDRALAMGGRLLAHYGRSAALGNLLLEGPQALEVRVDGSIDGVPVRAQIDCILRGSIPIDWKVAGANRPGDVSPMKGYMRCLDSRKPGEPVAHKLAGLPLDEIDEDWATQMTIYSELLGTKVVGIEQVIVGPDYARFATYRTTISDAFREKVKARLREAWAKITEERVVPEGLTVEELQALR